MEKARNLSTRWFAILAFVTCVVMAAVLALPGNLAVVNAASENYTIDYGAFKKASGLVSFPEAKITVNKGETPKMMYVSVTGEKGSIKDIADKKFGDGVMILPDGNTPHKAYTFIFTADTVTTDDLAMVLQGVEFNYDAEMKISVKLDGNETSGFADLPENSTFYYSEVTKHYYCYVDGRVSWTTAYNNALKYKFAGNTGYLLNIDNIAEQDDLGNLGKSRTWIGATVGVLSDGSRITSVDSSNKAKEVGKNTLFLPTGYSSDLERGFHINVRNTDESKEYRGDFFYWASGPRGEKSEWLQAGDQQELKVPSGNTEPNALGVKYTTTGDNAAPEGEIFQKDLNGVETGSCYENCALIDLSAGNYFNDVCERNYKSNDAGAYGYMIEFGGWDIDQDSIKSENVVTTPFDFTYPEISKDTTSEPVAEGEGLSQTVSTKITIANYNPNYDYKYAINDESNANTAWQGWKDLTGIEVDAKDATKATGSIEGLVYGDHVKVAAFEKNATEPEDKTVSYFKVLADELLNGSFEEIQLAADHANNKTKDNIYAWRTTAYGKQIEVDLPTAYGVDQKDETYVAEINAYEVSSLYQEIDTKAGNLNWSFSHAARKTSNGNDADGVDEMAVVIGPALDASNNYKKANANDTDIFTKIVEAAQKTATKDQLAKGYTVTYGEGEDAKQYFVQVCSDKKSEGWKDRQGTYNVPAGQSETVFAFTAISTAGGSKAAGNILDAITFAKEIELAIDDQEKPYDGKPASIDAKEISGTVDGEKVDCKDVTIVWYDKDGKELSEAPTAAGEYTAEVSVKNGNNSGKKTVKYTISPRKVSVKVDVKDKVYDGTTAIKTEDITATINTGVAGEELTVSGVACEFKTPDAGTGILVDVDHVNTKIKAGNDKTDKKNYDVQYTQTTSGNITKATPVVTAPTTKDLTYNGNEQPLLVTPAEATAGTVEYSIDGGKTWKKDVPTATKADTYEVYYRVVGGKNHEDVPAQSVKVEIAKAPAEGTGTATPNTLTYTGEPQALVTPAEGSAPLEYFDEATGEWTDTVPTGTNAGPYTVKYRVKGDENHEPGAEQTATVTIAKAKVPVPTAPASKVYTGETLTADVDVKEDDKYTVTENNGGVDVDSYKVVYSLKDAANYEWDTTEGTSVSADGKSVTLPFAITKADPKVTAPTAKELTYDGTEQPLVDPAETTEGEIEYSIDGGKTWTKDVPTATKAGTYEVYYRVVGDKNHNDKANGEDGQPMKVTVTVAKKAAAKVTAPTANNRTADGSTKPLLATPATTTEGEIEYSIDGGKTWTKGIPTASKAGTYTVCYRVAGDENHEAGPVQSVTVKIAEPDYSYLLNKNVSVTEKNGKLKVTWHKVPGAEGYKVYVQYCGKDFSKKSINQVKKGTATKITVTKVNGKKRNLKKNIKLYVVAYKTVNGKEKTIAKSIIMHFVGSKNTKYTNPKKITLTKSSFSLKVGKTAKIKGKVTLANPKKKGLGNDHARVLRFRSGNKKVATVSKSGKITAKGKGSCVIYVYARNGLTKEVKVTVK